MQRLEKKVADQGAHLKSLQFDNQASSLLHAFLSQQTLLAGACAYLVEVPFEYYGC